MYRGLESQAFIPSGDTKIMGKQCANVNWLFRQVLFKFDMFSVINDNYEHLDALAACFPWCTMAGSRLSLSRGFKCEIVMFVCSLFVVRFFSLFACLWFSM